MIIAMVINLVYGKSLDTLTAGHLAIIFHVIHRMILMNMFMYFQDGGLEFLDRFPGHT